MRLIKLVTWNVLSNWTQIPNMNHFCGLEVEKMKAKGEILIITVWVSSEAGEITAKFAYIVLPTIRNDCVDHSLPFTRLKKNYGRGCECGSPFSVQPPFLTQIIPLFWWAILNWELTMGIYNYIKVL